MWGAWIRSRREPAARVSFGSKGDSGFPFLPMRILRVAGVLIALAAALVAGPARADDSALSLQLAIGWDGVRRAMAGHRRKMVAEATYHRGATFEQSPSLLFEDVDQPRKLDIRQGRVI